MGGEKDCHQGSFLVLASRDTQDENNGRFPLDDPSTILCRDCRAIAQQRSASKGLSREIQYMVGVVLTLYSLLKNV